ncbi:MAG: aminotransferase class III-fold pyridoxal phosphate-dependent enzyme, partial [Actinobacteria bacterium]|nr:aminotransferase class III-fold pyridoxal phosphate-dependent enzyme [Actinomycetota bacterium]
AAGLPLSGVLGKAEIMDFAHDGAVGGTYVGNPVAQAAALAVLDVIEAALERGLLLLKAGTYSNCIRVLCPLVITDAELDEALAVWEEALDSILA